ncbi:MAG: flavodoxin-dependent (E)-4-hydroxy-3-methylbut-2-enyl-diphosphate synthase [Clostridiales bacterium]|jgi:(E)-4-hydroxy-3-methylbut-2-enyl-diphosphate synthase|nr:flavodoxin-dependent (E)-4-hydroxy-3-methylbut-2-enyl-diphosphate synthase [Clostridiales bacterium]
MSQKRKLTKIVNVGNVPIGGLFPITIQSMTNTKTKDVTATVEQIKNLQDEGCEIVRVAVNDMNAAKAVSQIKKNIRIPLVCDIHFDYRLAIMAIENGADKIRINPGNIGSNDRLRAVVSKAKEYNVPIRVGVNSGSLEKSILEKYGGITAEGLAESTLNAASAIENLEYDNIVLALKSTNVPMTIRANEIISEKCDYPLHIGITEAGPVYAGAIRSAVGIGSLLSMGIGDTIRVSLTGDPVEEVKAAREILRSLELRKFGVDFVSCPTCGRTDIDLISLATEAEKRCRSINKDIKVAVMGCVVNGPGEAKDADIGIAGGKNCGVIFKKGEILKTVPEDELLDTLMEEIYKM